MVNKLAIIGNGFDLAHGLNTLYSDFYKKMPSTLKVKWERLLGEYTIDKNYWSNFEDVISCVTNSWYGDSNGYFFSVVEDKKTTELEFKIKEINIVFEEMTLELFNYILEEDKKETTKLNSIEKFLDEDTLAISFNYTRTPLKYIDDVYYIHGSIKEEHIILGYKLRTEHSGIVNGATVYSKYKLRELLNFRRYLSRLNLTKSEISKSIDEFIPHLNMMNTGRGSYAFEYSDKTNKMFWEYQESVTYEHRIFEYFGKPRKSDMPTKLANRMEKERLKKISKIINDYGELNNFSMYPISLGVDLNQIEEIVILGHSLEADEELIISLFKKMINLKKIVLFTFQGESKSELDKKKSFINELTTVPIEIQFYEGDIQYDA